MSGIGPAKSNRGFTLFELVVTLTVLAILIMGTIPLAQTAVKRQREQRLRETLRLVRNAIDEFKRDSVGACPAGAVTTGNPTTPGRLGGGGNIPSDPRSRVVIDDCTIFDNENLDRYPPDIDTLVNGVKVRQRGVNVGAAPGGVFGKNATDIASATDEITKHYLREMPEDPMTGKSDWRFRSSYQSKDDENWDDINVFDIRSASTEEGLDGTKYSDW